MRRGWRPFVGAVRCAGQRRLRRPRLLGQLGVVVGGAPQAAAFGALTPVLALLGGGWFLGESISFVKFIGVFVVAVGVFLASGVLMGKSGDKNLS